jgi:hypothetical protein
MKLNITDNFIISNRDLKDKNPKMDVAIHLKYPSIKNLVNYTPKKRKKKVKLELKKQYLFLKNKLPKVKRLGSKKKPRGITLSIRYKELIKVKKIDCISLILISNINGYKKKKTKEIKSFFTVNVRINIQVENQKKGWQEYENRLVIIKAKSFKKAEEKVVKELKKAETPYLNPFGYLVKWKFEKVLDCYETFIEDKNEFDFKYGTEVFSQIKRRKIKKSKIWKKQWDKESFL